MCSCIGLPNFIRIGRSATELRRHTDFRTPEPGMLTSRPGLGLEAQKNRPRPRLAWPRSLVVSEVLLKCFVTLTLKIWYFLFNV